jgi:AcrR family transcriptional regulator
MVEEVKTTRAYHSPLRAAQAEQTRRRVLEAARRLFVQRGYAGTTVAAVADAAAVSPETIYLSLGGKRGLLEGVMEITGPHESAAADETWWQMVAALPSAPERLAKNVEFSCRILARTRPIHAIIRGAADKEAFAAALGRQLLRERLDYQTERIRRFLAMTSSPDSRFLKPANATARSPAPSSTTCSPLSCAGPPTTTGTGSPTCSPTNCSADLPELAPVSCPPLAGSAVPPRPALAAVASRHDRGNRAGVRRHSHRRGTSDIRACNHGHSRPEPPVDWS